MNKYQVIGLKNGYAVQNLETMAIIQIYKTKQNAIIKVDELNSWMRIKSAPVYTLRVHNKEAK